MYYCVLICYSVFLLYFAIISGFIIGFLRLKTFVPEKKNTVKDLKLSVLIPFKNEEKNLPIIFENLKKQTLNQEFFEVLFIDDRSTDRSVFLLKDLIKNTANFKLISTGENKSGKKDALKAGIEYSNNKLIVLTDADCFHSENRLETIYFYYLEYKPKMIIAPVLMTGMSFFQKLQAVEFLSLTASTAGAAGINHPIMCNGANSAFEKAVFYEFKDALHTNEISGDDVFLLHNIKKKYPKGIHYLKSNDATVFTEAETSLQSFIRQRLRWTSKSKSYRDFDTVFVSVIVFLTNILLSGALVSLFFKPDAYVFVISLFLIKTIPDFILILTAGNFFKQKKTLISLLILSVIYPFYVVFIGFSGIFTKNIKWKQD